LGARLGAFRRMRRTGEDDDPMLVEVLRHERVAKR
jgi:hypothetical protein